MSQSLSKLYVHIVFHVKNNLLPILREDEKDLYAYIGAIIKDNESLPILINGVGDHLHIFCIMSKNIALAKLTEEIKRHSSRWIKSRGEHYKQFAWQCGYAGFSVSQSLHERTRKYIEKQKEHHKRISFREELVAFLKEYKIDYNEEFLWCD